MIKRCCHGAHGETLVDDEAIRNVSAYITTFPDEPSAQTKPEILPMAQTFTTATVLLAT